MSKEHLKPFKKGKDPRRNTTGQNKGSFSLTRAVKEYLLEMAKDGESYGDKLKKAAVLRAITKSDVLAKEIWDRTDGKVTDKTDITTKGESLNTGEEKLLELAIRVREELRKENTNG